MNDTSDRSRRLDVSRLLLVGLALVALAALGYAILRAEALFVSPRYIAFYYAFPATLLAAALIAMVLAPKPRAALAASLLAVLAALVAAELVLRLLPAALDEGARRARLITRAAELAGGEVETGTMMQVVEARRAAGDNAYPLFSPLRYLTKTTDWQGAGPIDIDGAKLFPLGGIPNAVNVYCNEGAGWFIYRSDRYGFNNPDAIWNRPAPSRLAIVGNSWALGGCLPEGRSMAAHLRAVFPDLVNVSAGGTGPLSRLGYIVEYAALRRPSVVLWLSSAADLMSGFDIERRSDALMAYLDDGHQDLARHHKRIGETLASDAEAVVVAERNAPARSERRFDAAAAVRLLGVRRKLGLLSCPARTLDGELHTRVLRRAAQVVASWGGQLVFVYLPVRAECDLLDVKRNDDNWLHALVRDSVMRAGVPIIDLHEMTRKMDDPGALYFYPGSHFNAAGAERAAREILDRLGDFGLRPDA